MPIYPAKLKVMYIENHANSINKMNIVLKL